jgi:hypothetical protein
MIHIMLIIFIMGTWLAKVRVGNCELSWIKVIFNKVHHTSTFCFSPCFMKYDNMLLCSIFVLLVSCDTTLFG